jgi:hypothetical protein
MAQRGTNLMAQDQDYVVGATELPTSAFATWLLSGMKGVVMLHHTEASLQQLIDINMLCTGHI